MHNKQFTYRRDECGGIELPKSSVGRLWRGVRVPRAPSRAPSPIIPRRRVNARHLSALSRFVLAVVRRFDLRRQRSGARNGAGAGSTVRQVRLTDAEPGRKRLWRSRPESASTGAATQLLASTHIVPFAPWNVHLFRDFDQNKVRLRRSEWVSLHAARAAVPDASNSNEARPYPGQVRRNLAFESFLDSCGENGLQARRLVSTRTRELAGKKMLVPAGFPQDGDARRRRA